MSESPRNVMNAQTTSNAPNPASGVATESASPKPSGDASDEMNRFPNLQRRYGEPFYKTRSGVRLNQNFWAGQYAADRTILYEPDERAFYAYA